MPVICCCEFKLKGGGLGLGVQDLFQITFRHEVGGVGWRRFESGFAWGETLAGLQLAGEDQSRFFKGKTCCSGLGLRSP